MRTRRQDRIFTAIGAIAVTAWAQTCGAADLIAPAATQSAQLGLAFPGNAPEFYDLVRDAGIGVARVSVSWARVMPGPDQIDFSGLDARVLGLQARGIAPFLTFESDAAWATIPETQVVKNATPIDMAAWGQFVARVVERYDHDGHNDMAGLTAPVQTYQAANEFVSSTNGSGGWAGRNDALIAYVNAAHDAVKSADPNATFVLGGIAAFVMDVALVNQGLADWTVRQKWGETSETVFDPATSRSADVTALVQGRLMRVLDETRYDIADVHLYGPYDRDALRLHTLAAWSGRPVMSSECGGPSLDYGDSYTADGHFDAVITRNLTTLAEGGLTCLWFGLGEEMQTTWGNARVPLYDTARAPKPGVYAYRLLARALAGPAAVTAHGAGWAITWADGRVLWVAHLGDPVDFDITHCVTDAAQGRVQSVTQGADCPVGALVFGGSLGADVLDT